MKNNLQNKKIFNKNKRNRMKKKDCIVTPELDWIFKLRTTPCCTSSSSSLNAFRSGWNFSLTFLSPTHRLLKNKFLNQLRILNDVLFFILFYFSFVLIFSFNNYIGSMKVWLPFRCNCIRWKLFEFLRLYNNEIKIYRNFDHEKKYVNLSMGVFSFFFLVSLKRSFNYPAEPPLRRINWVNIIIACNYIAWSENSLNDVL